MRPPSSTEDSPFSEQILNWMKQGDRLSDARPPEVVDLRDLDAVAPRPTPMAMPLKRSPSSSARPLRRWLTVAGAAVAVCAGVVWATRQSVTIVDRPAFAAGPATARRAALAPSSPTTQPPGARTAWPVTAPAAAAAAATQAPGPTRIDRSSASLAAASKPGAELTTHAGHQRPATAAKQARRARR